MEIDNNTISVKVAAELVGLSERRIRQLCQAAEIGCRKIGREWLIDRLTLLEWHVGGQAKRRNKAEVDKAVDQFKI